MNCLSGVFEVAASICSVVKTSSAAYVSQLFLLRPTYIIINPPSKPMRRGGRGRKRMPKIYAQLIKAP